jgi:DNA-binding transcriptional ArsR family regulator
VGDMFGVEPTASASGGQGEAEEPPVLPERVPVAMPELPPRRVISTAEQFKAIADPTRTRILGIIQNQPATAKQIADRLKIAPGAAGHHLQVLEAAGLAQVVARRLVHGIVAKYYARTARIFAYDLPPEVTGGLDPSMDIMRSATNELAESLAEERSGGCEERAIGISFPHARMSPERVKVYEERLRAIEEDLIAEPFDPTGQVYGMLMVFLRSPDYMQSVPPANEGDEERDDEERDEEGDDR